MLFLKKHKFSYLLFFLFIDIFSCLRLDYLVHTPLSNDEIFSNSNIKFFFKAKRDQEILIDSPDLYQVRYPGGVMGYNYTTLFTISKQEKHVEILYKNQYIQNKIKFVPFDNCDGMHIQVESESSMNIPRFIHKRIIHDRIQEMMKKITSLSS